VCRRSAASLWVWACTLWPAWLGAQSEADLSGRIAIDGVIDLPGEYRFAEAVFRTAEICDGLAISPCPEEEPPGDSAWSALQDVEQIFVTWDASRLYLAVPGRIAGHALILFIDHRSGGMHEAANLSRWRRALRFGPDLRPDAFVAVRDGARAPELFLVTRNEALEQVHLERYEALASFEADAPGRALEISIPWSVLFPSAPPPPHGTASPAPTFVLPADAAFQGLRLAALAVHAQDGLGAADAAPDPSMRLPLEPRTALVIDRAARVIWDADRDGLVDFGAAVQTQSAARFVPEAPRAADGRFEIVALETFRAATPSTSARVLFPEAGVHLGFRFRVSESAPAVLYVTASIYSMRGERVVDLVRDAARSCDPRAAPYCFGVAARDRWDGRDGNGGAVPGGMYLLRVSAGIRPGVDSARAQRTIAVVD
jgi:hypothetical protein